MRHSIVLLLLAASLAACSSKPSASDVEKALVAGIGNCPRLEIDNVELVNGAPIDENTREVEFGYDLKVLPLPADEIKAHDEAETAFRAELAQIEERQKAQDARVADLEKQIGYRVREEFNGEAVPPGIPDRDTLNRQLDEAKYGQHVSSAHMTHKDPGSLSDVWGSGECRGKTGPANAPAGISVDKAARDGMVLPQRATWTMRRTDNGWMPAG